MAPLPLFKLGALLVRTLAKPLAKRIKVEAANHPRISRWTIALGQLSHNFTARLNVLASGYKLVGVKPLEEAEALSRGADIIGEATIFAVAGLVLVLEYSRQKNKEARETQIAQEIHDREQQEMQDKIDMLIHRIDELEEHLSAKSSWWGRYPVKVEPKVKKAAITSPVIAAADGLATTSTPTTTATTSAAPSASNKQTHGSEPATAPAIAVPVVTPSGSPQKQEPKDKKQENSSKAQEAPVTIAKPANEAQNSPAPTATAPVTTTATPADSQPTQQNRSETAESSASTSGSTSWWWWPWPTK